MNEGLILPPTAKKQDDVYADVICPVRSAPVFIGQGIAFVESPCSKRCAWYLGDEDGKPLCAVVQR